MTIDIFCVSPLGETTKTEVKRTKEEILDELSSLKLKLHFTIVTLEELEKDMVELPKTIKLGHDALFELETAIKDVCQELVEVL